MLGTLHDESPHVVQPVQSVLLLRVIFFFVRVWWCLRRRREDVSPASTASSDSGDGRLERVLCGGGKTIIADSTNQNQEQAAPVERALRPRWPPERWGR